MRAEQIENWTFGRSVAAELLEMSEGQLANWLDRYELFPAKSRGTGHAIDLALRDLLRVAAMKKLVDAGMSPQKAADALRPYQSPWGTLLHAGRHGARFPGTVFLTQNADGRWVGADSPAKIVCIEIRAWPLFDDLYPRFRAAILANPGRQSIDSLQEALRDFEARVDEIRQQRWASE